MNLLRVEMVLSLVCVLFPAAAMVGCGGGGSSSSDDPVALCKQSCDKTFSLCFKDGGPAGISVDSLKSSCTNGCTMNASSTSKTTCTNSSEIVSAYKTCLGKSTCNDLMSCAQSLPACKGGTSTGSGTGGTTTTGGSAGRTSGGASGSSSAGGTCADLLACCNKATDANLKSACMMSYSAAMMGGDSICSQILTSAKSTFCP